MVDEYKKIEAEIQEILRKLNNESISYKGSDIYKLYRDYLKLSMKLSFNSPSFEMDKSSYKYGNCYCYALGLECPEEFARMFNQKCVIFFPFNIGLMHTSFTSHNNCINDLNSDLDELDIRHYDVDYKDPCEHGGYKIALFQTDGDFHFVRENSDGSWSHKYGFSTYVERMDKLPKYLFDEYEFVKAIEIVKPLVRRIK